MGFLRDGICLVGLVSAASGLIGCGGSQTAVRYSGDLESTLVHPEQVTERPALPPGYYILGSADSRCHMLNKRDLKDAWLSDVDCSEERLTAALREQAADVGGNILVEKSCHSSEGSSEGRVRIVCEAQIARPTPNAKGLSPEVPEFPRTQSRAPRASEAWSIRVSYTPADRTLRQVQTTENVGDLALMPLNHRLLGDVIAECEAGCSEAGARLGLRSVAGRMGANAVVEAQCARQQQGWLCAAKASGYEVDPAANPAAR